MQSVSDYFHVFMDGEERSGLFVYALGRLDGGRLGAWRPDGGRWESVTVDSWVFQGVTIAMMKLGFRRRDTRGELEEWREWFGDAVGPALELGAEVSWLGAEDSSWNPEVLRPGNSFGNVIAALGRGKGLVCEIEDVRDVRYLSDESLVPIWDLVVDLLNVGSDRPAEQD